MKVASVVELVLTNVVLLVLYSFVTQDYATRSAYWHHIGFTPTFNYAPLVFVLSSTSGATRIPGLLTLDWTQVLLMILIIVDGLFALEAIMMRNSRR